MPKIVVKFEHAGLACRYDIIFLSVVKIQGLNIANTNHVVFSFFFFFFCGCINFGNPCLFILAVPVSNGLINFKEHIQLKGNECKPKIEKSKKKSGLSWDLSKRLGYISCTYQSNIKLYFKTGIHCMTFAPICSLEESMLKLAKVRINLQILASVSWRISQIIV